MSYCIALDDDHGRFWLTEEEQVWRDDFASARRFESEAEAAALACFVRTRAQDNPDWFPKLKVIKIISPRHLT